MESQIFKELYINGIKKKVIATSYSQIEVFLNCPYRWYLDYLLGQRIVEKQEALALGSAIHTTLEQYFNTIKDGGVVTLGEAQDMLSFNMECEDIPYANKESQELAETQHMDMISGLCCGTSKLAEFMKDKEVIACEKAFQCKIDLPFSIKFGDETYNELYIIGSIDFIARDKQGGIHVVDFKSGKKMFNNKKLKENLQLPIYSLIIREAYGVLPKSTQYYFTRLDEFQNVMPLANCEEECQHVYYKNGKIKQKQRIVSDVMNELIDIFRRQYTIGEYEPKPCALCSWCSHSPWYGELRNCKHAQFYRRTDFKNSKSKKIINTTQYR